MAVCTPIDVRGPACMRRASGFPEDDEGDSSFVFHADAGRNALKGVQVLVDHGVGLGAKSGSSCVVLLDVTKDMVWRVHILLCRF